MKGVYQTIVGGPDSNCVAAVVASLFDLQLGEVPACLPDHKQAREIYLWYQAQGLHPCFVTPSATGKRPTLLEVAQHDGGVHGYFHASVPSQTFKTGTHAVVVDTQLQVVWDPNPNQLALALGPDDVIGIWTVRDWVICDGHFTQEDLAFAQ